MVVHGVPTIKHQQYYNPRGAVDRFFVVYYFNVQYIIRRNTKLYSAGNCVQETRGDASTTSYNNNNNILHNDDDDE